MVVTETVPQTAAAEIGIGWPPAAGFAILNLVEVVWQALLAVECSSL